MKKDKNDYVQLAVAMCRTGILGYGGGPSVIPLIRHDAVTRYNWLSDDEFGETLAIANALPGPIATKMAAYLGYKLKGVRGAFLSVLAHILPSCIAMIALLSAVNYLSGSQTVAGMIAAVSPVIAVMLGMMAYEFAQKAFKGLGKWIGAAFLLLALVLLEVLHVHPAIVIVLFLGYGAVHYRILAKKHSKGGNA
ncbi:MULTISPECIES: chromate transporter [unclassified Paenibacillus]|uniref:chromate transporter n=1 Tax=unclassified Paenibacillus TaxID=185978 RepID=UPI002406AE8A|nr:MULTISPECIES: chromate transporter [unclassified Paenibacillus]MDF9843521.1 chromate transporter [Paenibacillus sp. PastF-2]MDF9850109.1 chromate transporter [Paenibacillus sp. PastM-2]MDF9857149.1 chromate transporter [Paenibacillus sp. PastF-1]MDH6482420.1 chromate transporter [Paenibacillus sp. PastH-2]MDH6509242.1 chromate transporter [Paenibacillus sp. PastM-3]